MTASEPLTGTDVIDCAKASAEQGVEAAARQCGYGEDVASFQQELKQACDKINVEIETLGDLVTEQDEIAENRGVEVAPETLRNL
ncbi:MAG: hypothetical protein BRC49_11190 [Cyanobacteria bacterium SW_10_48_33]|nr:MAG: hypothetical protein BRC49_11190 [Cyanobacteria bacterium SW_10_48_33]